MRLRQLNEHKSTSCVCVGVNVQRLRNEQQATTAAESAAAAAAAAAATKRTTTKRTDAAAAVDSAAAAENCGNQTNSTNEIQKTNQQ